MFGSRDQELACPEAGSGPGEDFLRVHHALRGQKGRERAAHHGHRARCLDVDLVLTTREFVRMLRADKIIPALLPEEGLDSPMGVSTGAGVIFGATGGVMEAALRTASFLLTGQNPDPEAFSQLREAARPAGGHLRPGGHLGALRRGQRPGQHPEAAGCAF